MKFTPKFFDPGPVDPVTGSVTCSITPPLGKASVYVYDRPLILAINVALAANRPLLLAGEPGSGKTSLARNIALKLQWSYYETTITSRTQSTDLVWEFDALARLNAAYGGGGATLPRDEFFVRPGPLWWALAPDSAQRRGMEEGELAPTDKRLVDPGSPPGMPDAVLLVDELDKAEPEVPNDLLEIVDARSFRVRERPIGATRQRVLIIFSTNGERDFPGAFERRCVVYRFPPDRPPGWYAQVAARWLDDVDAATAAAVADRLVACRAKALTHAQRQPGTAEYLDALRAMRKLGIGYDPLLKPEEQDPAWQQLEALVFRKAAGAQG